MAVWTTSWITVWCIVCITDYHWIWMYMTWPEWCCLAELTRISIENGNAPVAVPDFTRGSWNKIQGYRHALVK